MPFLRRRLKCFYCNKTSPVTWSAGLESFQCQLCDATNHLDENGDITDPPTTRASRQNDNRRYAQKIGLERSHSPTPDSASSPFCHTCTSNQQFITQSLAEYLPAPTDPKYRQYEKSLPEYKRSVEARYPPVCADCEPRVRAQLQQAGYMAKSDYMRRMLKKTKTSSPLHAGWSRKHVLGLLGLPLWIAALALPVVWHTFGLLAVPDDGLRSPDEPGSLTDCVRYAVSQTQIEPVCASVAFSNIKMATIFNVLTIWWNPVMLRSSSRADGLGEFYRLQLLLLLIRVGAWYVLDDSLRMDEQSMKGVHVAMLVLNLVITAVCLNIARPRRRKPVDFSQEIPRLIDENTAAQRPSFQSQPGNVAQRPPTSNTPRKPAFPVSKLGNALTPASYTPLTPPPDLTFDDPDAMDIDQVPSQTTMLYREGYRPNDISSSLRPQLVPAPLSNGPAQNTRNRGRRLSSKRSGSKALPDWMSETTSIADTEAMSEEDESPVKYDQGFIPASVKNRKDYEFAGPKLNVKKDETGLEGMFKDIFGFGDEPGLPQTASRPELHMQGTQSTIPGLIRPPPQVPAGQVATLQLFPIPVLTIPAFFVVLGMTYALGLASNTEDNIRLSALGWIAAIGVARLFDTLRPKQVYWELSNVLIYAGECILALYLASLHLQQHAAFANERSDEGATSTRPQDPVVAPDTEWLEEVQGRSGTYHAASDGSVQVLSTSQAFYLLLGWTVLQELTIVLRPRRTRLQPAQ